MTRLMATWVIIAALATIGVTALLTGVLYRLNASALKRSEGGDGGAIVADPGPSRHENDAVGGGDGGRDGGGGSAE